MRFSCTWVSWNTLFPYVPGPYIFLHSSFPSFIEVGSTLIGSEERGNRVEKSVTKFVFFSWIFFSKSMSRVFSGSAKEGSSLVWRWGWGEGKHKVHCLGPPKKDPIPSFPVTPARQQLDSREEMALPWFYVSIWQAQRCTDRGKMLLLGVSVKVFPEEISIWFRRVEKGCLHQGRCASPNPFRAWAERKGGRRVNLLCAELSHPPSPSLSHHCSCFLGPFGLWPRLYDLAPLVLRTSGLYWNYTNSFPGPPACRWQIVLQ